MAYIWHITSLKLLCTANSQHEISITIIPKRILLNLKTTNIDGLSNVTSESKRSLVKCKEQLYNHYFL